MSDLYSTDKLVEFGMSMSIAQQLCKTMNDVIRNTIIPGAMNPVHPSIGGVSSSPSPYVIYAILDGKQSGPYSETECARLIIEKKITKDTYIWMPGFKNWQFVEKIPSILRLVALVPPEFKQ